MKTALVIGVREDQSKEALCLDAGYVESRKMVAAVATDGPEAAEALKAGYVMLELHMIGRGSRVKACRVRDHAKIVAAEKAKAKALAEADKDTEDPTPDAEADKAAKAEAAKIAKKAKAKKKADAKAKRLAKAKALANKKAEDKLLATVKE